MNLISSNVQILFLKGIRKKILRVETGMIQFSVESPRDKIKMIFWINLWNTQKKTMFYVIITLDDSFWHCYSFSKSKKF